MAARGSYFVFAAVVAGIVLTATPGQAQGTPPGGVSVIAVKGAAAISWKGVRDAKASYRVLRGTDPRKPGVDVTKPLPYDVTSVSDPAVPAGTTVYYTVVAVYSDGTEGASDPVPFTAPGSAAPMPTAPPPRGAVSGAPLTMAPPMALRPTRVTTTGPYNQVTVNWAPILTTVPGVVTYVVRRLQTDPATLPPNAPVGYVTGVPALQPDGRMGIIDRFADLEAPTWYMVVATSTSQGSLNFPWYRRDPPPHRGVDTLVGGYWREVTTQGTRTIVKWNGCVRASRVPNALFYGARLRFGNGNWVPIQMTTGGGSTSALQHADLIRFDTTLPYISATLQQFENGGTPQIQAWPTYSTGQNVNYGPFVADTMHLQPLSYVVTLKTAPLNWLTCM